MHNSIKTSILGSIVFIALAAFGLHKKQHKNIDTTSTVNNVTQLSATGITLVKNSSVKKIQVAILLDVSNSMDGLIEQAKAQLWNMVNILGKAQCNGENPNIEIALYEYGRDSNDKNRGYVKQLNGFTNNLDLVSQNLFKLTTNGGDEYCGQVMFTSLNELQWDESSNNYKVIFIAGNEDFLQGSLPFTKACSAAKEKEVIINTIYCGDRLQGIREHWNLGSECGKGSFTNINSNAVIEDIETPYDSLLFVLNNKLNGTYIAFGYKGEEKALIMADVDVKNYQMNKSVAAKRVEVKSKSSLYNNSEWDMVDAQKTDSAFVNKVDIKTLPKELQNKSRVELQQIVKTKTFERNAIQKQIAYISIQREKFLQSQRNKSPNKNQQQTLETEIEKILKQQAAWYKLTIN